MDTAGRLAGLALGAWPRACRPQPLFKAPRGRRMRLRGAR